MSYPVKCCRTVGQIVRENIQPPFPGGTCYRAAQNIKWEDGLVFPVPKGASIGGAKFLTFDFLLSGYRFITAYVKLQSKTGESMHYFMPLCECQSRIVIPLPASALKGLKSVFVGLGRKTELAVRFCISPPTFTEKEPPFLNRPALPRGPLVDEMGQTTLQNWPGKHRTVKAMVNHLQAKLQAAPRQRWPSSFSRWGGWKAKRVKATGFFRTHHDGRRWWLVDPDGYLFWSAGLDCVHSSIAGESLLEDSSINLRRAHAALPDVMSAFGRSFRLNPWHSKNQREFNYMEANFIRAFGPEAWYDRWITVAHAELRRLGFNTAGDWSDEYAARREGTPYVRPLELFFKFPTTPMVGPDLPDVFHPNLVADARELAETALRETRNDPGMLGYFLHNEPPWGYQRGGIAASMMLQTPECKPRRVFAEILRKKYGSDAGLRKAWEMDVSLKAIAGGAWTQEFSEKSLPDLLDFSSVMLDRLAGAVSKACRKVDPHHLNLGWRWWSFPPIWALKTMGHFDVATFNYYFPKIDMVSYGRPREAGVEDVFFKLNRPIMIGEWHFGALDGGLPSAGLRRVANQVERGKSFRIFQEYAAALPWCVGAHWFIMYDENSLFSTGSSNNGNIGFLSGTHTPHEPICRAARLTHERLYALAAGKVRPYDVPVKHLFPSC